MLIVFLDMDGTIVNYPHGDYGSSWDAVIHVAGKADEGKRLLDYYLPRPNLYKEWFQKECMLLKGVSVSAVKGMVLPPVYVDGAAKLAHDLRRMGITRGLLTAGVGIVARHVEKELQLDFCECNELLQENGSFTGEGMSNVRLWDKKRNMIKICNMFGIKPDSKGVYQDAVVLGDHDNELGLFEIAGLSIAYMPKSEKVAKAADHVVKDLNQVSAIIRKLV
jgi:phosphoserine phosphatase